VRAPRIVFCGLAAVAALALLFVLASDARHGRAGIGAAFAPAGVSYVAEVSGVNPGGAAAAAGLRPGDRIDVRRQSLADRLSVLRGPVRDRPLDVSVDRGARTFRSAIVPAQHGLRATVWLAYIVLLWTAIFAGTIAWRRPELPEARLLSLMLSAYVLSITLNYLRLPLAQADIVIRALSDVCGAAVLIALVAFTALFGRPLSRGRRLINAAAYASVLVSAAIGLLTAVSIVTLRFDPVALAFGEWPALVSTVSELLVLLAGAAAIAAARGSERQRVVWAVSSMGLLLVLFIVNDLLGWLAPNLAGDTRLFTIDNIIGIVTPVGLTYSVLSRRLLDVGFALNRAVVYSVVSVVVVGLFMTVENLLGGWLTTVSHAESLAVSVAVALAIGFSIRWIHGRIDRFVDVLFFRKRHRGEQALLRFAHEAAFVTDRDVLLSRAVGEVAQHTEAQTVAILLRDGAGTYVCASTTGQPIPDAGENDAAVLSMRASGNPVDLHGRDGALRGEYAFPMMARGTLIGTLVCGAKPGAEPYAPDERDALRAVAHGVGMALDTLTSKVESLDAAIRALPEQFAALRAEIRELREALQQQST
jgi:GAF domain-containing protein